MFDRASVRRPFASLFVAIVTGFAISAAQTPAAPVAHFSAVTANLNGGPDSVRIDVLAWSTDAVRTQNSRLQTHHLSA